MTTTNTAAVETMRAAIGQLLNEFGERQWQSGRGVPHKSLEEAFDAIIERAALAAPAQAGWCKDCNPDNCGGCATPAAIDYRKDGDAIHDDLTSSADDVALLYAKYDELYRSSCGQAPAQAGEYPPLGKGSLWRDAEGIRGYGTDPGPGPWYTTEDVHRAIDAAMAAQKDGA